MFDCIFKKDNIYKGLLNGEWIESESNYYVSKKRLGFDLSFAKDRESIVKTMRVTNTPNQNVKTTILFKMETMRTKTWKELIK